MRILAKICFFGSKFLVIAGSLLCASCQHAHSPGGPYYFKSMAILLHTQLKPVDEIGKDEAERLAADGYAYGIAYFDSAGRLLSYAKTQHHAELWKCEFSYDENGRFDHQRCRREDGSVDTVYVDASGNVLRKEQNSPPKLEISP